MANLLPDAVPAEVFTTQHVRRCGPQSPSDMAVPEGDSVAVDFR